MKMPSPLVVVGGLLSLTFITNAILIYLAVSNSDAVVPSYTTEQR